MFLYWPVILVGLTLIVMFLPAPILYHRSREWWAYSNVSTSESERKTLLNSSQFRLLLAGVYPVEFRDFFLGDMYCSQTYSMGVSKSRRFWSSTAPYPFAESRTLLLSLRSELERSRRVQLVPFTASRLFLHRTRHLARTAMLTTLL